MPDKKCAEVKDPEGWTCKVRGVHPMHMDGEHAWPNQVVIDQINRPKAKQVLRAHAGRAARPDHVDPRQDPIALSQKEGMARSFRAATPEFKAAAKEAIEAIASRTPTLTTDDVWDYLRARGFDTEHRASMGTIVRNAVRGGVIEKTGQMVATHRPDQRAHGLIVWRSLVYREGS